MYPITNEVKALFEAEQRKVLRITGTDKNGATITITDDNVMEDSFQIDRYSCNGEKLEVGTAVAAQMTLQLFNGNGQYDSIAFEGAELNVEIGIADWTQSSPTITYIPCGIFTPDEQPRRLSTISITALDRMTKFDVVVDAADLTFQTTIAGLVGQVCTLCGVTLAQSISGLVNAGVTVTELPTAQDEITYRNLIQWCAGIMGTNAWFDWNGQLRFSWYANTTGYVSTTDNRYNSDMYEDDLTVSGVEYTNNSGIVIVEGTDDYAIDLTGNAIAGPLVATVLPPLNTALNGFTYRPFTAATVNAPYLWPMDIITFTDKDGNDHTSALTNVAFGLNGTTAMEAKGMTYAINKLAQPKGFTREQAQLVNQAMEHVEQDIDESLTQQEIFNRLTDDGAAQGLVLYNGQLYINASYINAGYLSADRIAAGAISADKIAANAITSDKIAANAITASKIAAGAITADMITSGEMSAARIKGGTLTLGGIGNRQGTLEILNGFDQVCGGWNNSRMFANGFQLTGIVDGELVIEAEIVPLAGGGVGIHNQDDSSDWLAYFDPDQASFNNNLYVGNNAIIHGALYLGEALAVQEGGTGATTAAGARENLGVTPANIGAVDKSGDTMTGQLTFQYNDNKIIQFSNAGDNAPKGLLVNDSDGRFVFYQYHTDNQHADIFYLPTITESSDQYGQYDILTSKNTIQVPQGGTGATTPAQARANLEITPANIGAVAKSGDTMTGQLTVPNMVVRSGSWQFYYMQDSNGAEVGHVRGDEAAHHIAFREITPGTNLAYEDYFLPNPTIQNGAAPPYYILTTKSAVGVPQGGTGATTAAGARTNLGLYHTKTINNVSNHSISIGLSNCIILGAYLDGVGNTICLPYRASGGTWYMSFWTGINLSSYTPSNATLIVMYRDL